ncbi:MAG: hypothetical protein ABIH03_11525 [Pseudomonadota bacterium]
MPPQNLQHIRDLGYGNDAYRAIGDLNRFNQLSKGGWTDFVDQLSGVGLTPQEALALLAPPEGGGQAQPDGAPSMPQQPPTGQYLTMEAANKMVQDSIRSAMGDFQRQSETSRAQATERQARQRYLESLGYKPKAESKYDFEGRQFDGDPLHDLVFQPAIVSAVQKVVEHDLMARGIRPGTKEWEQAAWQPATESQVERASKMLAPYLKSLGQQAVAGQAADLSNLPPITNGEGPGGRPQKAPADMSPEEMREFMIRKHAADTAQNR